MNLLFTCEHGGNSIPREYRFAFRDAVTALQSHRGYDPGALELARRFAKQFQAPLEFETRSRLLIELNRTLGHPCIFSEFSRTLPANVQTTLIDEIYLPYRQRVMDHFSVLTQTGPTLHLSVHSFTPVMNGKTRRTEIGLLFDPARTLESTISARWKKLLKKALPNRAIHFNLPYRGTSDGLTTALRKQFPEGKYAGIELEINQKFPLTDSVAWREIQTALLQTLAELL
ncbi:N-formylglutamate amidohydrolase [Planctomicrobium sp. SH668]|uniref:N-formylglutamate amidohydrolase n=1 Tax=Planctomicrobium sp. SH668 TaxID=3448126 RepID=UPI003F5B856C